MRMCPFFDLDLGGFFSSHPSNWMEMKMKISIMFKKVCMPYGLVE